MGEQKTRLLAFSNDISNSLVAETYSNKDFSDLATFPLIKGKQVVYVMNWLRNEITYSRGINDFFGYQEDEFNMAEALNCIHPEDEMIVSRVVKGIVNHCIQENVAGKNEFLNLTYRIRRKDGSFVKVLRKSSAYEINEKGMLISNWSIITDIGFISNNNQVEWDIYANGMDVSSFKNKVYEEFQDFFTPTELLVIHAIHKGYRTNQIASKLNISNHTVATHRKNINRKSNCSNAGQVLAFCHRNGIL